MNRQIITTSGQGLAAADAAKFSLAAIAIAGIVLLLFFALDASKLGNHPSGAGAASSAAAPAPTAT